jgi:undecaprenyl diphosphate synthase
LRSPRACNAIRANLLVGHQSSDDLPVNHISDPHPVVPVHVAIIMDGNGRWAERRGLPRQEGHRRGVEALRRAVRLVGERGIKFLTVYSFSTENWRRPATEVSFLMGLLKRFIENDLAELHRSGVRVRIIGARHNLPNDIKLLLERAEVLTQDNTALTLVVAFNYGARDEMARAVVSLAADIASGVLKPSDIDEDAITRHLDTAGIPDPDLVIRTSGEHRVSNFLLWQAAYAEFVFTDVLWPDFDAAALDDALSNYHGRQRRFGGTTAQAV